MATYGIDRRIIELLRTYHKYVLLPKQIGTEGFMRAPLIVIKWEDGPDTLLTIWGSDKSGSHIELSMDPKTGNLEVSKASDNFKPDAEFIKELIRKYATIKIPPPAAPPAPLTPLPKLASATIKIPPPAAPPAPTTARQGLASAKAAASNLFSKAKGIFSRGGKRHSTRRHRRR
jgi:hypothetical protein